MHESRELRHAGPATLADAGVPAARAIGDGFAPRVSDTVTEEVSIVLGHASATVAYTPGETLLQTARMAGLQAPSSCEVGSCGTCMARLTQGSARMLNNDALDDDEVADGWVLTCQSLPTSRRVRVVYE